PASDHNHPVCLLGVRQSFGQLDSFLLAADQSRPVEHAGPTFPFRVRTQSPARLSQILSITSQTAIPARAPPKSSTQTPKHECAAWIEERSLSRIHARFCASATDVPAHHLANRSVRHCQVDGRESNPLCLTSKGVRSHRFPRNETALSPPSAGLTVPTYP